MKLQICLWILPEQKTPSLPLPILKMLGLSKKVFSRTNPLCEFLKKSVFVKMHLSKQLSFSFGI